MLCYVMLHLVMLSGPCRHDMARLQMACSRWPPGMEGSTTEYVSHGQPKRCGIPSWGLGKGLTTRHCKKPACYKMSHRASEFMSSCEHGNESSDAIKGNEFID